VNEGSAEQARTGDLQFDRVELGANETPRACAACKTPIHLEYYEVLGNVVCPSCARDLDGSSGSAPLVRGLLYGGGAALVSMILWYAIIELTDREWGIIAIAVGFFVGWAVRKGSRVGGGWRFQTLAMMLTYLAITVSHVPFLVEGLRQAEEERVAASARPTAPSAPPEIDHGTSGSTEAPSAGDLAFAWTLVLLLAFISPFLAGTSGILGLVIIAVALYEAWKLNKRIPVTGPFRLAAAPAPAPAPGTP
jgi:hypothetical protein